MNSYSKIFQIFVKIDFPLYFFISLYRLLVLGKRKKSLSLSSILQFFHLDKIFYIREHSIIFQLTS
ncbi:hypothetical protein BpHYR1_054385 [Brachionus plicatilis]|uniref:Uncharacterized protein n=1 Tax=Brachionus plicatilis TaxID=10195 RepID=A0A3M7QJG6_BRAPC|nr:hypothetical protein BpHYR1_054385 [Brachionus plicatilis]